MVNILIFRTDKIGDLLLTIPTILTIKKYLGEIDKPKYIWLSHEHSDHFSVPFINEN